MKMNRIKISLALLAGLLMLQVAVALAVSDSGLSLSTERSSWLLERGTWSDYALTGVQSTQNEIGGNAEEPYSSGEFTSNGGGSGAGPIWNLLASAVLPGAGEALMGHKRGYAMMAVDIFAWTQYSKYNTEGNDLRDEYYAFADAHYSDEMLVLGYQSGAHDARAGLGAEYFPTVIGGTINDVDDLHNLSLYVSVEDDRREWYENLGKWDQFIFGWDDFRSPYNPPAGIDFDVTGEIDDLRQPWISENREIYRSLRGDSNDAFLTRDRWLYVNIGLRVFSVLQVAYLGGVLGGSDSDELAIAGHPVQLIVQPYGMKAGTVAAAVDF